MKLNYSAFNEPVTKTDIETYKSSHEPRKKSLAWMYNLIVFGAILFVCVTTLTNTGGVEALTVSLTLAAIGIVIIGAIILNSYLHTKRLAKLHKFAVQNNISFRSGPLTLSDIGMIFDEGHSRTILESFVFDDNTEIGNYQYITGSGKNQQTHNWAYVRIKLTRHLPNMVLDARKNNLFGRLSNLPDSFKRDQTLSLEGDFNNHFTLYAPKQYERDALYIFTPDVMAAVIDAGQAYDIEVIDDNLVLYASGKIRLDSEESLSKILLIINKIAGELRDQSHHYADERIGDHTQNIVAEPGRRLKSGVSRTTIVIVVLAVLYYLYVFIDSGGH